MRSPSSQPHRLLLEPGLTFAEHTLVWVRPAYAYVWQREGSKFGLSTGLGVTLGHRPGAIYESAGPELGIRYGTCCEPMYLTLTGRYELDFHGGASALFKIGISYF